ncbi:sodium- and chloride-dependent glycine transporter 1-like [Liolophura sinensis]|uniref:sodium- and chloride-dependent glycine transporter 1-like n=1 Tax=Liolophura sinensis TaxID=3198878 RepID=UPI0031597DB4
MDSKRIERGPSGLLGGHQYDDLEAISPKVDDGPQLDLQGKETPDFTTEGSQTTDNDRKPIYGVDENEERGNWTGRCDFVLAMLGFSVGLGNVWRFPYLCYQNGGGAFLIPYTICLLFVGIPMFFLEISLAQFCSNGPMTCWQFAPLFKGVGIAMMIISGFVTIYYNMIIAWAQFYLFASFTSQLPWISCENAWNSKLCLHKLPIVDCTKFTSFKNGTCYNQTQRIGLWNDTVFTNITGLKRILPTEEYWNNYVLHKSTGIHDIGNPQWALVLNLLLAWVICFFCLMKGIKTTGKVVYFTALFPYVVLLILLIRGLTLDNAIDGIRFYIIPKFEKLLDANVWRFAANQIFYSMGMGWGGLHALASYNRFHNNTLKDALIVSIGGCLTSFFAGFVIFAYLGHMAGKLGKDVEEVATDGPGLAFVVYPEAVSQLPAPTVWAILFFFMLITLGLDSQFTTVETVLTGMIDQFPHLRSRKTHMVLAICIVEFFLGLPVTTRGGVYILQLMDQFIGAWSLPIVCLVEALVICYIYGGRRFLDDISVMTGKRPSLYWLICWAIFSPVIIVGILIFAWADYSKPKYGDDYFYPIGAEVFAWILSLLPIVPIPVYILYKVNKASYMDTLKQKLSYLTTPTRYWGPALVKHRRLVHHVPGFVVDPNFEDANNGLTNLGFVNVSESSRILETNSSLGSLSYGKLSRMDTLSLGNPSDRSQHSLVSGRASIFTIESNV